MIMYLATDWPQGFGVCFLAGIAVLVVGIGTSRYRACNSPIPGALAIAAAIGGGLLASRLWMLSGGLEVLAAPHTGGKNLLAAVVGGTAFCLSAKYLLRAPSRLARSWAIVLPLAAATWRLGCFFSGCCHGTVTDVPWAIVYPAGSIPFQHHVEAGLVVANAATSLPVHPAQVYEIAYLIALAIVGSVAAKRLRNDLSPFFLVCALYCAARFFQAFVRADAAPAEAILSPVQWALAATAIGLGAFVVLAVPSTIALSVGHIRRHSGQGIASVPSTEDHRPSTIPDDRRSSRSCAVTPPAVGVGRATGPLATCGFLLLPPAVACALLFSPLERVAFLLAIVPLAGHLLVAAVHALHNTCASNLAVSVCSTLDPRPSTIRAHGMRLLAGALAGPRLRHISISATAMAMPLLLPLADADRGRKSVRFDAGGAEAMSHYHETCDDAEYTDHAGGGFGAVTYQVPDEEGDNETDLFLVGAKAYGAKIWRTVGPQEGSGNDEGEDDGLIAPVIVEEHSAPYWLYGAELWGGIDSYWFGIDFGLHVFSLGTDDQLRVMPSGLIRVLPEDKFFFELAALHGPYASFAVPADFVIGFPLGDFGSLRMGAGGAFLVAAEIFLRMDPTWRLVFLPYAAIDEWGHDDSYDNHDDIFWSLGLTVGVEQFLP